jgi:ribosome-associated protein
VSDAFPNPDPQPSSEGVEVAPGVTVPAAALRYSFARSSGPGGQNVNKLATKAELRIALADLPLSERAKKRLASLAGKRLIGDGEDPAAGVGGDGGERGEGGTGGEVLIVSQSERSQSRNRAECLAKLRELLVRAMAEPKVRRKTRPSRGSIERRLEAKKARGQTKRRRQGPGTGGEH